MDDNAATENGMNSNKNNFFFWVGFSIGFTILFLFMIYQYSFNYELYNFISFPCFLFCFISSNAKFFFPVNKKEESLRDKYLKSGGGKAKNHFIVGTVTGVLLGGAFCFILGITNRESDMMNLLSQKLGIKIEIELDKG